MIAGEIRDLTRKLESYRATGLVLDPFGVAVLAGFFETLARQVDRLEQALDRAQPPPLELRPRRDPRACAAPPWGFGSRGDAEIAVAGKTGRSPLRGKEDDAP